MGFFGFGLMLLVVLAVFLALSAWGACTKRPMTLFISLLAGGVVFPFAAVSLGATSVDVLLTGMITIVAGAIGAGILGAETNSGIKARLLMGFSLITFSALCYMTFFGMIEMVPVKVGTCISIMKVLSWSIIAPIGLSGILELAFDLLGLEKGNTLLVPAPVGA